MFPFWMPPEEADLLLAKLLLTWCETTENKPAPANLNWGVRPMRARYAVVGATAAAHFVPRAFAKGARHSGLQRVWEPARLRIVQCVLEQRGGFGPEVPRAVGGLRHAGAASATQAGRCTRPSFGDQSSLHCKFRGAPDWWATQPRKSKAALKTPAHQTLRTARGAPETRVSVRSACVLQRRWFLPTVFRGASF